MVCVPVSMYALILYNGGMCFMRELIDSFRYRGGRDKGGIEEGEGGEGNERGIPLPCAGHWQC